MAKLPGAMNLSVNISAVQLRGFSLPASIQAIAAETGFPANRVTIEITESALAEDLDHARAIAATLKDHGLQAGTR